MSEANDLALTALVVSLVALVVTTSQMLQQFFGCVD